MEGLQTEQGAATHCGARWHTSRLRIYLKPFFSTTHVDVRIHAPKSDLNSNRGDVDEAKAGWLR